MLYLVALSVVTLAACLIAAIVALPLTVRLVLAHVEATQQVNGTPVQLLREKHEQQFELEQSGWSGARRQALKRRCGNRRSAPPPRWGLMRKKLKEDEVMAQMAMIDSKFQDAASAYRLRREEREFVNAMFYRGLQVPGPLSDYDPAEDEVVRIHNIIRPIIRAATAATLRQMPNISCPAAKDDARSLKRAKNTELLCRSWTRSGVIDWMELHRTVSWSKQCGLRFLKVFWNPDGGRMVQVEEALIQRWARTRMSGGRPRRPPTTTSGTSWATGSCPSSLRGRSRPRSFPRRMRW